MAEGIKKFCWCGCSSFDIYQWEERKGDITIVCQSCRCERHISTPGVSVEEYALRPEFKEEEEE